MFHQIDLLLLYESIFYIFTVNANMVKAELREKI